MIIDEIKKANLEALKSHDNNARAIYSVVINKYMLINIENKSKGIDTTDVDTLKLLNKVSKELEDEYKTYSSAGRVETANDIKKQLELISKYLPKLLSEEEIKNEISKLTDKSIPSVMKHFKTNFAGKVDMGLVSKIARNIK